MIRRIRAFPTYLSQRWQDFAEADALTKTLATLSGIAALFAVVLLLAVGGAILFGGGVADLVSVIRDLFIILLAVQGMLVSVALIVLILQVAATVNLIRTEIGQVIQHLQDTAATVKGTSEFLSENVTAPVIESKAWFTGVSTFIKEVSGVWQATKTVAQKPPTMPENPSTEVNLQEKPTDEPKPTP